MTENGLCAIYAHAHRGLMAPGVYGITRGASFGCGRGIRLAGLFLTGIAIALAWAPGRAQAFDYVITFDNVVVHGAYGTAATPDVAHLELPGAGTAPRSAEGADRAKESDRPPGPPPTVAWRAPDSPLRFAPTAGGANPSFVQQGFLVEAFWAVKTGTPEGFFMRAHFHPADLSSGFEAQHLGHPNELHGIFIRSLDGKPFGLKSLRYRVTRNRELPNKPWSIIGFNNFNVSVLVARSFDPRGPILAQFAAFPVGLPAGNDPKLPWWPLRIFGFEQVDQVYLASSASVDLDDIVLTRSEPPSEPPEPREEDK